MTGIIFHSSDVGEKQQGAKIVRQYVDFVHAPHILFGCDSFIFSL